MPVVMAIAGFLGAWLLVAGPVFQAATELDAEEVDRTALTRADSATPPPAPVSPWWWLLPPVAFVRQRRATQEHRLAMLRVMTTEELAQLLRWGAKATGWLIVALGAALIATKETWEVVELLEAPSWAFPVLLVVALGAALLYAPLRLRADHRMKAASVEARRATGSARA